MTESQSPAPKTFEEVLEGHLELKTLLSQIDRALEESEDVDLLARMLGQLGDRIIAHFTLEEEGGYFSEAMTHSPRLVARANSLMAQHPKLSTKARTVLDPALAASDSDSWRQETRKRFDEFRDSLLEHERGEDRLLQEAYTQDIGSND